MPTWNLPAQRKLETYYPISDGNEHQTVQLFPISSVNHGPRCYGCVSLKASTLKMGTFYRDHFHDQTRDWEIQAAAFSPS